VVVADVTTTRVLDGLLHLMLSESSIGCVLAVISSQQPIYSLKFIISFLPEDTSSNPIRGIPRDAYDVADSVIIPTCPLRPARETAFHHDVYPPSTRISVPVAKLLASEAR